MGMVLSSMNYYMVHYTYYYGLHKSSVHHAYFYSRALCHNLFVH